MLDFALGFLCAIGLVVAYICIVRNLGEEAAIHLKQMIEDEGFTIKKLPGGGTFRSPRPDNKRAQQIRIRAGLMEGELDAEEPPGSSARGRSSS